MDDRTFYLGLAYVAIIAIIVLAGDLTKAVLITSLLVSFFVLGDHMRRTATEGVALKRPGLRGARPAEVAQQESFGPRAGRTARGKAPRPRAVAAGAERGGGGTTTRGAGRCPEKSRPGFFRKEPRAAAADEKQPQEPGKSSPPGPAGAVREQYRPGDLRASLPPAYHAPAGVGPDSLRHGGPGPDLSGASGLHSPYGADEALAKYNQGRHDPVRQAVGIASRRQMCDRYFREELDKEENRVWWGRYE